ncbi:Lipoprotein [Flavobacterium longum]|uniref:DUF6452 family protein n=1 Tax=Flavobacterium longum TaxID=1299340 RepID=UPI0039E7AB8E
MKKLILIPVVALIALFSWNCEKDDICSESTPTTPRLVVQFYDINDPTTAKNVTSLLVSGTGASEALGVFSGVSQIVLPLRITEDQTQYTFTLNSNNTSIDNTDVLTFNYTRDQVFVSRACGYKTVFTLDDTTPFVQDDGSDLRWMNNVTVEQPNILNEDEVHISVLF